jgi:hypothetical protein
MTKMFHVKHLAGGTVSMPHRENWVRANKPAIARRADAAGLCPFSAEEIACLLFQLPN